MRAYPLFSFTRASQTTGRPLMMVLPYNYEALIPLLQARASTLQATQSSAPPAVGSPWARDFMMYIKGVPTYYLSALQRVLQQPFGVQGLIPGEALQSGGGVLHRKVMEKLNSLKELAGRQVERADRIERAGRAQDPEHRQQQQQDGAQSGGGGTSSSSAKGTYSNAFQVPIGELLSQWETMRTQLYGTGGATVSGLFSAGPSGQHRLSLCPPSPPHTPRPLPKAVRVGDGPATTPERRDNDPLPLEEAMNRRELTRKSKGLDKAGGLVSGKRQGGSKAVLRSPVLACVAESLAPARSTQEMSNFMSKMRGVEFPRDPLREPGPDEHMRQGGGFQRLMASTTFESPFAKKKSKAGVIDYSPLELDEAANESAILDMEEEEDDAKDPSKNKHKNAGGKTGDGESADSPGTGTPAGNATPEDGGASPSAGGGDAAAASSSSPSCASPGGAGGAPASETSGGGGLTRMSSMSRKMLPKLVASRGRRKMGKDKQAASVARRGEAAGGVGNGMIQQGQQRAPPDAGPASPGAGSRAQGNDRREELLIPPMSPALVTPRTPDHPPPASPAPHLSQSSFDEGTRY
ncbi:unnamed protein product, partial [Hapterophycus canaliculatus]